MILRVIIPVCVEIWDFWFLGGLQHVLRVGIVFGVAKTLFSRPGRPVGGQAEGFTKIMWTSVWKA